MTTDTIACPFDDCDREWPDTYGAEGGRLARVRHIYAKHRDDCQGRAINQIERLGR